MAATNRKPTLAPSSSPTLQQRRRPAPPPSTPDDDAMMRQLLSDIRLLESSARVLQSRLDIVSAALSETLTAIQTLEGNRDAAEGAEALIPIGSGSFVKAKLADPKKAIVGFGAGVCIEKSTEDSVKELRLRSSELEKARATITNQLEQVLAQTDAYRGKLSDLVRR